MNKRANLYFAALLGAMSPLSTVTALAAQSNSMIATATQQQNSCTGTVKDASGEPIIGATIRIDGKSGGTVTDLDGNFVLSNIAKGAKLTIYLCRLQVSDHHMEWCSIEHHPAG